MKTSFKLFALLFSFSAFGQQVDSFSFLGNHFDKSWKQGSVKIIGNTLASSNSINTAMFYDFLVKPTLGQEAKEKFIDGTQKRTNIYSLAELTAEYKINDKWGAYAKAVSVNGYGADKALTELLFFGNAPFVDQTVGGENFRYLSYSGYGTGATYRLGDTDRVQTKLSFGVTALNRYRAISSSNVSLFTASRGEYIDLETRNLAISEQSDGSIKGIGIDLGLDLDYSINEKNAFSIQIEGLNITRMLNHTSLEFDTSLRFTGIGYDLLRDTNTLEQYVDSNYLPVVQNARGTLNWVTLPARVRLQWSHSLSDKNKLIATIQSVDLGKYGVTGTVGLSHKFNERFMLNSTLGYGNYAGIVWRESAEYRLKNFSIYGAVQGLHALLLPQSATNYGIALGVSKQF